MGVEEESPRMVYPAHADNRSDKGRTATAGSTFAFRLVTIKQNLPDPSIINGTMTRYLQVSDHADPTPWHRWSPSPSFHLINKDETIRKPLYAHSPGDILTRTVISDSGFIFVSDPGF